MDQETDQKDQEVLEDNQYHCRQLNLTFHKPCTLVECIAHSSKMIARGFKPSVVKTRCAYVDFHEAGFPEDIDFAVKEQGRVGYRDLDYISPFFRASQSLLREEYERQERLLRLGTLILVSKSRIHNIPYCKRCGMLQVESVCEDSSSCDKRVQKLQELTEDIAPLMSCVMQPHEMYAILWKDMETKRRIYSEDAYTPLLKYLPET